MSKTEENVMFLKLQDCCWEDQPELSLRELVPLDKQQTLLSDPTHPSTPAEGFTSLFTKEKGAMQ